MSRRKKVLVENKCFHCKRDMCQDCPKRKEKKPTNDKGEQKGKKPKPTMRSMLDVISEKSQDEETELLRDCGKSSQD